MDEHWLGIHDHANSINNWKLEDNQYSWLRAFEKLPCRTSALLKINNKQKKNNYCKDLRGVDYYFEKRSSLFWEDKILSINPTHILWNICYYSEALSLISELKKRSFKIFHCIRIHHDVAYLLKQNGFLDFARLCDHIITPTEKQSQLLRKLGFKQPINVIPFGIDNQIFVNKKKVKDIDFVSCSNKHPLRNYRFLKLQFLILNILGIRSKNIIGYSRFQLNKYLQRSRFFFLTSLTEASGSRVLLEAISSGCYPLVFEECNTAVQIIKEHNYGTIIKSNFRVKMPQKVVFIHPFDYFRILFILIRIKRDYLPKSSPKLLEKYLIKNEVSMLTNILFDL